jgi:hypothetical protein
VSTRLEGRTYYPTAAAPFRPLEVKSRRPYDPAVESHIRRIEAMLGRYITTALLLLRCSLLVAAGALLAAPASAHHSPAIFALDRTVTLEGRVLAYEWTNPHVYIRLMAETGDGQQAVWEVEGGSPTMMERSGMFADTLRAGDRVVVQANPARNAARRMVLLSSLQKAGDGAPMTRDVLNTPAAPSAPLPADSLSGNWLPATPAFLQFVGPLSGWPLTDKAKAAAASFDDAESEAPECVSIPAPFLMAWNDLKQIELGEETTVIRAALIDDVERIVDMNAASHDGAEISNQGHSIGRWQGGILVVDTTHFAAHSSGNRAAVPSGERKHLIERFALSADRTRLTYSYELEDPEYLTEVVTGSVEWAHRPDLQYTGYACDPQNARRFLEE